MDRIIEDINKTIESLGYPSDFVCLYDQIECLKSDTGRETFLVINKEDGKTYIAKCYDKKTHSFITEIDLLKNLNYDGIPKYIDTYTNNNYDIIIREYVEGITLTEYIKNNQLTEKNKIAICDKLADILIYLHNQEKPIIHRDIKPDNIIVKDNGDISLIDFDIARTFKNKKETDTVFFGTKVYAPPEQYGFEQTSQKADIYAFGVLMRYLFTGDVRENDVPINNTRIKHIINKCTAFSPKNRYSDMKKVKEELLGKKNKVYITLILLVIMTICVGLFVSNKSKVVFKEPLIEQAVRLQLNLNETQKINKDDLLNVKELYICANEAFKGADELFVKNPRNTTKGSLSSLDDIEFLPNLEVINIIFEEQLDISGIVYAKNLRSIDIKHTNVDDISPLAELKNLNSVFLFATGINDCRIINDLPSLEHLDIGYTNINSFSQIGRFPHLKELSIKYLGMYSLDGIEDIPSIEVLWLNNAGLGDISAITKLPNLRSVHTDKKYVDSISRMLEGRNIEIIVEE